MKKNRTMLFISIVCFLTMIVVKNYYFLNLNKTMDVLFYIGIILISIIPLIKTPYLKKTFEVSANIKKELRLITWAKGEDVISGFWIVLIFVIIIGTFVIGSDYLLFKSYEYITS